MHERRGVRQQARDLGASFSLSGNQLYCCLGTVQAFMLYEEAVPDSSLEVATLHLRQSGNRENRVKNHHMQSQVFTLYEEAVGDRMSEAAAPQIRS